MKKINIGIIGCGYWGPNLVRNFANNSKCNVKIVSDLRIGRLEYIRSLYPQIAITLNASTIINDDEIDAVVIATPVNTHKEIGIELLKKNKHIFVEKPLTDSVKSAEELNSLARINKRIVAVGHIFQFAPAVTAMKKQINDGLLGSVYRFDSQRVNLGPPNTTVDVIWDLAPHDLSILLYLFNEKPNSIYAEGKSYWWKNIVDNADIILGFPSGKIAHINVSWLSSKKIRKTYIFGENGNMEYDETLLDEEKVKYYDRGIDDRINAKDNQATKLSYGLGEIKNIPLVKGEPLSLEVDAFLTAILENKPPINDGLIGKQVVEILEQASKLIIGKK